MRRVAAASVAMTVVAGLAACGGGEKKVEEPEAAEPLTAATLGDALDDFCRANEERTREQGAYDNNWPGLAIYNAAMAEDRAMSVELLEAMTGDAETQQVIDDLIVEQKKAITDQESMAKAAAKQDSDAYTAASESSNLSYEARIEIYEENGAEYCAAPEASEITVDGSGTSAPADITAAAPGEDALKAASDALQAAVKDGPKAMEQLLHSDFDRSLEQFEYDYAKGLLEDATVVATEAYGPAGTVEYELNGYHSIVAFLADDSDDGPVFRFTRLSEHVYGATNPAPEGNDAQAGIEAFTQGVLDGDAEAFNSSLYSTGEGSFEVAADGFTGFGAAPEGASATLVADVREVGSKPVLLGQNLVFAFWLLEGTDTDWVITQIHRPGLDKKYVVDSFWPVPKA